MLTNPLEPEKKENLQKKLQEIKDQDGIDGYILRGSKSASIDLKDPTKIIDYAILSSTIFDISNDMSETLNMNQKNSIVLETEETKLLSMNIDDYKLSIFMENDVNHKKIYKSLK